MIEDTTLKVAVLPADTGACGHSRLIWPAEAVAAAYPGWDIRIYDPRHVRLERMAGGGVKVHGMDTAGLDLLVTQRVGARSVADLCSSLRAGGVAVLMDMDDAMWCLDPDNTAYESWNADKGRTHWERVDRVAATADMVTVTTRALADRYGKHGRVQIHPNRIPRMALAARGVNHRRNPPLAGWAGLLATHPNDPGVLGDAVKLATDRGLIQPAVMGDGYRTGKIWGTKVTQIRMSRLGMDYYRHLAMFDIGMVPLDLEGTSAEFNAGKSSLKALEYAACGVAVIASPSPANVEFARQVPIRLASTPGEWLDHFAELADPGVLAAQVAAQSAALVEHGWVLQERAYDWAGAWVQAVMNRRNS